MYKGTCKICGKSFYVKRKTQKYCSKKCFGISNASKYWLGKKMPERSGKKHHNWKNGKAKNGAYIIILMPSHPFCNSHDYIMEHRLVMEKHLGRYLKPQERIHHINGIKDDNRISNLMLFPNQKAHFDFHRIHNKLKMLK